MSFQISFPPTIRDRNGQPYLLVTDVDEIQWIFRIRSMNRKVHVAQANCLPNGEVLRLMDFHLEMDFRRIGLGSNLLSIIIKAATNHFKMISGVIKSNDLSVFPDLPTWYADRGFSVDQTKSPIEIHRHLNFDEKVSLMAPDRNSSESPQ